mmetsp:Transcript_3993/g.11359  ORF Transcript_3993/g.11359 Transcript_3993/m.11359 type:complete len:663 (-) Transcript_3993:174-2162(-)
MRRPNCSQRISDDDRACPPSARSIQSVAVASSATVSAASSPQPPRSSFGRRRGIFLTTVAAVAVVLGSSSPVFAFGPHHKNLAPGPSRSSGSRLPSSASYAADQPDNSTASGASALKASAFAPPAPGRSSTGDDGDQQEDEATTAARTLLASKTEEMATLRAAQADQLLRISELTSNLANVHGDTDKLYTDLVKSQAELAKGLEEATKLISEVSDATGTLTDVEVQRMEAMTALEDLVGTVEDAAAEEVLEIEEEEVVSASAVEVQIAELREWKLDGVCATGRVFNHPSIGDGDVIVTSALRNPGGAREGEIVQTESGSQYKLGTPQLNTGGQAGTESWQPLVAVDDIDIDSPSYFAVPTLDIGMAKSKLDLTGEAVGNGRYLLAGSPIISKHGRSEIWSAYRANGYGLPKGEPLCVKLSQNMEAMSREDGNYRAVTIGRSNRGKFVKHFEFIPAVSSGTKSALVMERGTGDLKGFVEQVGALEGGLLRDAVSAAVQCVQAVHDANLVWTDLKAENFVVVEERLGTVGFRGIDLESAMPKDGNPVDYSPEACPPEFAKAFLADGGQRFVLHPSYDIWSLGTLIYELATGQPLFDDMNPLDITKTLPTYKPGEDLFGAIPNDEVRDIVKQCLQPDPKSRPTISQLSKHPYLPSGFNLFRGLRR